MTGMPFSLGALDFCLNLMLFVEGIVLTWQSKDTAAFLLGGATLLLSAVNLGIGLLNTLTGRW